MNAASRVLPCGTAICCDPGSAATRVRRGHPAWRTGFALLLALPLAACEQRTVMDPTSRTHASELGLQPRSATARGSDYATKDLLPGRGIGDIRLDGSTLADVERILGTDYRISSLTTSQQCGPDGCRDGPPRFAFEYVRLSLTIGFERSSAGLPVEQSRVRLVSVHCGDPARCAWRGATAAGLRIGDADARAVETHGNGRRPRGSSNRVHAEGLAIGFTRAGTVESLAVFRPEDLRDFQ